MGEIEDLLGGTEDLINNPNTPVGSDEYTTPGLDEFMDLNDDPISNRVQWEGVKNIGDRGIGDSQWDKNLTYSDVEDDNIHSVRQTLQPWTDQLGNAVTQAVVGEIIGGTIEGVGYLLDWQGIGNLVTGNEKEFGNWFSDMGKSLREGTQDITKIYEKAPGEIDLFDSGFWFKNSVSVASTLSMMLPSMAATKALGVFGRGVSRLAGKTGRSVGKKIGREISEEAFDVAKRMGVKADWMTEGISQAIVSRHIENSMEASGTFEEIYNERMMQVNKETGKYYTDEEAKLSAADGAANNYKHGWAMLAQDMIQYLSIGKVFNPATRQMEVARKFATKSNIPDWAKKAAAVGGTFVSEAGEEGYQHYIASRAKLGSDLKAGLISKEQYDDQLSEVMSSDEAKTSMLFGGLGGSVFQMIGPKANDAFKSKSRKEFEEESSKNFNTGLGDRNKVLAALQIQKNKADSSLDKKQIEEAQDEIILEMVIDAIDNDNVEMTMEAIMNGPEMTKEEKDKFNEDNGYQWDSELAKKGAERTLKIAKEVKEIHYRNLNKAKNKKTDSNIIKAMTLIEYQNNEYQKRYDKSKKDQISRIKDIKYNNIQKPSERFIAKKDVEAKILATKEAIRGKTEDLEGMIDKESKDIKSEIIKNHNFDLSELKKELKELEKVDPKQTEKEAEGDGRAEKVWAPVSEDDGGLLFEVADGYLEQLHLNDAMTENTFQLTRLNDKEFQKALINKQTAAMINNTTDQSILEKFKSRVEKDQITGYSKTSEKEAVLKQLTARIEALEKAKTVAAAKKIDDDAAIDLKNQAKDKNANTKTADNNVVVVVEEALEDEHREEEIWFEEKIAEKQEQALEIKVNNGKSIALLDEKIVSPGYKKWVNDGKSKIGTKVRYELARRGSHRGDLSKLYGELKKKSQDRLKAEEDFAKAIRTKSPIPQNVYDFLPIQVFIGEGNDINTFLPDMPTSGKGLAINLKRHKENYVTERKNIIDGLYRGEVVSSTIQHTSGGQLQTQVSDTGVVAENSIRELEQVKKSKQTPKLAYSNIDGQLYSTTRSGGKPVRAEGFEDMSLSVGDNPDGTPRPYRGGLFIIIRKADGTPFPVRLNFLRNTNEQAEVLADLLIDIAVPEEGKQATGKSLEKKYKLSAPLSSVDAELRERIEKELGPEVNFLGKDPTLNDIINMFVYVSERTEGLTSQLYMKGVNLYFGDSGNNVNPKNKASKRQELVDFLRDTKRRQLSLKMWNDTKNYPGYRNFVMDNKIINTNVVTNAPEFQTETKEEYAAAGGSSSGRQLRRVQVYAKPVNSKVVSKPVKVKEGEVVKTVVETKTTNVEDVIKEETGVSLMDINAELNKKFPGKFYTYDGKTITILGKPASPMDVKLGMKVVDSVKKQYEADNSAITIDDVDTSSDANQDPLGNKEEPAQQTSEVEVDERISLSEASGGWRVIDGKKDAKDFRLSSDSNVVNRNKKIKEFADNAVVVFETSKDGKKYIVAHVGYQAFGGRTGYTITSIEKTDDLPSDIGDKLVLKAAESWLSNDSFKTDNPNGSKSNKISYDRVKPRIEESIKSLQTNDTKTSTPVKKYVPSVKVREVRTRRRSIGGGSTNSAKPNNTKDQSDSAVKKEDDKKQPKCENN